MIIVIVSDVRVLGVCAGGVVGRVVWEGGGVGAFVTICKLMCGV